MNDRSDEQLVLDMATELSVRESPITVVLRPLSALQLVGLIQLALRHPQVEDANRLTGVIFIAHVREFFADAPAVLEVIRRGESAK
jgi:hypothetical protein